MRADGAFRHSRGSFTHVALILGVTLLQGLRASAQFRQAGWSENEELAHSGEATSPQARHRLIQKRCRATLGGWCGKYDTQALVPRLPIPRGDKQCVGGCNGVGNCNADTGLCECPAGWRGSTCDERELRPCTIMFRNEGTVAKGFIDAEGRDLDIRREGYTESRCGGICNADISSCFCDGRYKRVHAPAGSPPGTPPLQRGRPLGNHVCQPNDDGKGYKLPWGQVPWAKLYGPTGWCEADEPEFKCPCMYEGFAGLLCDEVTDHMCVNQCSGRGACYLGFCKCDEGWYGTDCARPRLGVVVEPGYDPTARRPWLKELVVTHFDDELQRTLAMAGQAAAAAAAPTITPMTLTGGTGRLLTEASAGDYIEIDSEGGSETGPAPASDAADGGADPRAAASGLVTMHGERVTATNGGRRLSAAGGAAALGRKRPLIYVYDLPPAYNARMLQYRVDKGLCTWRVFEGQNNTGVTGWPYAHEVLLHELLLQSPHRTFDPEAADYFYVPVFIACLIFPLHSWADGPWWYAPSGPRTSHAALAMLEAKRWLQSTFPWWDRRDGRDHIWLMTHDEGACYAPSEVYNTSIMLTNWGRLDLHHKSNTAFSPDNYTQEHKHPTLQPNGWLSAIQGHPCYTPGKDLVMPGIKMPFHYSHSPLMGAAPLERDILLFLRGDVGLTREPHYSRGIRQALHKMAKANDWAGKHRILIGTGSEIPGDYSNLLARSKFALVVPGDGWSARAEDAMLHGCVPLIIMDDVATVFDGLLDWTTFSLRLPESQLARVPEVLNAVPARALQQMQRRVRGLGHRFAYMTHPKLRNMVRDVVSSNANAWERGPVASRNGSAMVQRAWARRKRPFNMEDDAFGTLMAWLYSRLPATR